MLTAQLNYKGIVLYLTIASRINAFNVEKLCVERGSTSRHINVHYVYTTHEVWS